MGEAPTGIGVGVPAGFLSNDNNQIVCVRGIVRGGKRFRIFQRHVHIYIYV